MRYVILRDDDTNGLTPVECLERLYRPFLERGLPVNLATIPKVQTNVRLPDGRPEGFLGACGPDARETVGIDENPELVRYLQRNPGYQVVQHGYHHSVAEFDSHRRAEIRERLERGTAVLLRAGFPRPRTFVAPYDKLSAVSLAAASRRFAIISTGWFEWRRLPARWWPAYLLKKFRHRAHWRVGNVILLSHPGCLLSFHRPCAAILPAIQEQVRRRRLTVLVTHWWEYFRDGRPDQAFIEVLHRTAAYLADQSDLRVIAFEDVLSGQVPLN
ncbi:MAG: DUF2334 domain-containing protein [Verrucomicrobia bacterium]|nr:DUF2334 domain-containing protein [Verrucomicrobiota bacterium]